jgi:hypothetical protein
VLLLSIWDGRRTGTMVDPTRELADVYKCIDVLKAGEERSVVYVSVLQMAHMTDVKVSICRAYVVGSSLVRLLLCAHPLQGHTRPPGVYERLAYSQDRAGQRSETQTRAYYGGLS